MREISGSHLSLAVPGGLWTARTWAMLNGSKVTFGIHGSLKRANICKSKNIVRRKINLAIASTIVGAGEFFSAFKDFWQPGDLAENRIMASVY